jgi:predicted membrane GTPase involved in stress response
MVNMTHRPNIHMRLRTLKLRLTHDNASFFLSLIVSLIGYSTDLRSRTQGRATYTMQFDSYQQVPEAISSEIVKRVRGE